MHRFFKSEFSQNHRIIWVSQWNQWHKRHNSYWILQCCCFLFSGLRPILSGFRLFVLFLSRNACITKHREFCSSFSWFPPPLISRFPPSLYPSCVDFPLPLPQGSCFPVPSTSSIWWVQVDSIISKKRGYLQWNEYQTSFSFVRRSSSRRAFSSCDRDQQFNNSVQGTSATPIPHDLPFYSDYMTKKMRQHLIFVSFDFNVNLKFLRKGNNY